MNNNNNNNKNDINDDDSDSGDDAVYICFHGRLIIGLWTI